ncbi:caspase family protein [Streptomyces sp. NPDC048172]|uniref:caspase, EACC1-associated type n=1 Tax=Streptomyces sp. NPDC048172 TaxID=3365505 RepID=UPI00372245CE
MPRLPDPGASRAVLIGVAAYQHLEQLPAVTANVRDLSEALRDTMVWGLPREHCATVSDPDGVPAMLDPVAQAAEEATDTLLVYFAGHGLRHPDSADLYMALSGSRAHIPYTAVAYEHLRAALREARARRRVLILDCCFSGRAVTALDAGGETAPPIDVDGVYVLAAAARDRAALAPDGEPHTAFTRELLDVLRLGVQGGPELIDLDTLYRALDERLRAKNRPQPQRCQENNMGLLPLVRNRAKDTGGVPAGPVLTSDVRAATVSTGLRLARLLRAEGRQRDALPVLRLVLQESLPQNEGSTFAVQLELSELLADTGHDREAIEVLEQAYHHTRELHGPEAVLVCRRLAALLQESGNHIQACEVLRHALDLSETGAAAPARVPTPAHPSQAQAHPQAPSQAQPQPQPVIEPVPPPAPRPSADTTSAAFSRRTPPGP